MKAHPSEHLISKTANASPYTLAALGALINKQSVMPRIMSDTTPLEILEKSGCHFDGCTGDFALPIRDTRP